ncbi:MAG: DUF2914 domain-containing protein [Desulfatiglandaceae bacterium]
MNRLLSAFFVIVVSGLLSVILVSPAVSQEKAALRVSEGDICIDVVDHSCVGVNEQFPPEAGRLYCLSRILGATDDTYVTHVWYFGETERARVKLEVRSGNWRTYSSKLILPREIGQWRVDILGPGGNLLQEIPFEIRPQK